MSRYSEIENNIWEELQNFSKNAKILYIFAFSNPSVRDSGMYVISTKTVCLNTGLTETAFRNALKELEPKLYYDFDNKIMFVSGKLKRRLAGLKNNKNVIKAINHDLAVFKESFVSLLFCKKYEGALKGLGSPSLHLPLPLPNTINNIDQETITLEEYLKNDSISNLKTVFHTKQGVKDHLVKTMGFVECEVDKAMGKEF